MSETQLNSITPNQCRKARALLGWSRDRLAPLAGISINYLGRFERETVAIERSHRSAIRIALEAAGVEFSAENGQGPGVRLRKEGGA